ncbi:hypothetical protein [Pseudomonas aeruginosa]
MIDPADKQTQPLPLEQPKRGRGRPATGNALSDAERARRYRANKKKRDAQPSQKKSDNADLLKQLAQAQARIAELEAELASRVTKKEELDRRADLEAPVHPHRPGCEGLPRTGLGQRLKKCIRCTKVHH